MNKPCHTEEERLRIENGLRERRTPYAIAKVLDRPVRTVVRKIRARRIPSGKGAFGHVTNRCLLRKDPKPPQKTLSVSSPPPAGP